MPTTKKTSKRLVRPYLTICSKNGYIRIHILRLYNNSTSYFNSTLLFVNAGRHLTNPLYTRNGHNLLIYEEILSVFMKNNAVLKEEHLIPQTKPIICSQNINLPHYVGIWPSKSCYSSDKTRNQKVFFCRAAAERV